MLKTAAGSDSWARYDWEDPLNLASSLQEDERMLVDAVRAFCKDRLMPRIVEQNRNESTHFTGRAPVRTLISNRQSLTATCFARWARWASWV